MKTATKSTFSWLALVTTMFLLGWFAAFPPRAKAQNAGKDAVYDSSGTIVPSPSFIDASVFIGTGTKQSPNIWRVAQVLSAAEKLVLGAPLFRVLCERVGASVKISWIATPLSQKRSS